MQKDHDPPCTLQHMQGILIVRGLFCISIQYVNAGEISFRYGSKDKGQERENEEDKKTDEETGSTVSVSGSRADVSFPLGSFVFWSVF